jgi:hypothetical protein
VRLIHARAGRGGEPDLRAAIALAAEQEASAEQLGAALDRLERRAS